MTAKKDKKVGGEKEPKAPKAPKVSKGAESVNVLDKNGDVIRNYSLDVHGDSFLDHANEFAGKEEGRKVVEVEA